MRIEYLQKNLIGHNLISIESDTVSWQRKTLLSFSMGIDALYYFAEPRIEKIKLTGLAKVVFCLQGIFSIIIFSACLDAPEDFNLPLTIFLLLCFAGLSFLYYWTITKPKIIFKYMNGSAVLSLDDQKNCPQLQKFLHEFKTEINKSHITREHQNLEKLKKGIYNLQKQGLMSIQFMNELLQRIQSMEHTTII